MAKQGRNDERYPCESQLLGYCTSLTILMLPLLTKLTDFASQTSKPTWMLFTRSHVFVSFEFGTELRMKSYNVTFRYVCFLQNSYHTFLRKHLKRFKKQKIN